MRQHAERRDDDPQIAPDRPVGHIFKIGLEPVDEILVAVRRPAVTAHLRESVMPGLMQWRAQ